MANQTKSQRQRRSCQWQRLSSPLLIYLDHVKSRSKSTPGSPCLSKSEVPSAKQKKSPANNTKNRCMFAGGLPSHQHGKEEDYITAGGSSDPPRKSCNLQDHVRTVQANAKPLVDLIIMLEGRLLAQKLFSLWEQPKFFSNVGEKLPSLKTEEKKLREGKLVACTRWHVVH